MFMEKELPDPLYITIEHYLSMIVLQMKVCKYCGYVIIWLIITFNEMCVIVKM